MPVFPRLPGHKVRCKQLIPNQCMMVSSDSHQRMASNGCLVLTALKGRTHRMLKEEGDFRGVRFIIQALPRSDSGMLDGRLGTRW